MAIIVVMYVIFLIFDYNQSEIFLKSQYVENNLNIQRIKNIGIIDNVIIGGSNSLNSLSAEQMSVKTGEKWYNASMNGEMGNINLYNNFIIELASNVNANNISKIVYSSVLPYIPNGIASYNNERYLTHRYGIRPNRSFFSYIKNFFSNRTKDTNLQPLNTIYGYYGDLDNRNSNCFFRGENFKYEKVKVSAKYLAERIIFLNKIFPNAHIYIVLPSIYYNYPTPEFSKFKEIFNHNFNEELIRVVPHLKPRVTLLIQDHYPSSNHICNDGMHAVPLGRTWRTSDLLTRLGIS